MTGVPDFCQSLSYSLLFDGAFPIQYEDGIPECQIRKQENYGNIQDLAVHY